MLGLYQKWGFRASPFETRPLPPTADGEKLLIGRGEELTKIGRRLLSPTKIVTVEGANGIGKTSIMNVASYQAFNSFLIGNSDQLLVPCEKSFQIRGDSSIDEFADQVFYQVALTLLKHAETLRNAGRGLVDKDAVAAWLTSPTFNTVSVNISALGLGGGGGSGTSANTSTGFARAGFNDLIRNWLKEIFPSGEGGGIVCSIDNLELLRASEAARTALEELRDEVLTIPGLRWIICGSTGIVRTLGSTPRLQGYLHAPVEIGDVAEGLSGQILRSRIDAYGIDDKPFLPVVPEDFSQLYHILQGNIRDTLSAADDYCNWVADMGDERDEIEVKRMQFAKWLATECKARLVAALPMLSTRPWRLFDKIVECGGQCSPGAFREFDFETPQGMRSQVIKLEAANLVKSVRDEEDNRRKTILVTSNGWMVRYARETGAGTLFSGEIVLPDTREEE